MVGTSKILTVSYGTFSCTLEGFEDSFSTMKAIAEYFRDLAADDRYFGAEPPTPDAEMLARIAEREIARRVEARQDGNEFVLKASQALTSQPVEDVAEEAPAAEATVEETSDIEAVSEPDVADTDMTDDIATADAADADGSDDAPADDRATDASEHVADAMLHEAADDDQDAEAAQADDTPVNDGDDSPAMVDDVDDAPLAADPVEGSDDDDVAEDVAEDAAYDLDATTLAESLAARPTPHRVVPAPVSPAADAPMAEDAAEDEVEAEAPVLPPAASQPPIHPDADSVAAKLQRIRAVVGQSADQGDELENEHAMEDADPGAILRRGAEAFEEDVFDESGADEARRADEALAEEDTVAAAADEARRADEAAGVQSARQPEESNGRPAPVRARVVKMRLADYRQAMDEADPAESADAGATPEAEAEADPDMQGEAFDSAEDQADLARLDGMESVGIAAEDSAPERQPHSAPDYGLSAEEEADLMAELAEVEQGAFDDDIEAEAEEVDAVAEAVEAVEDTAEDTAIDAISAVVALENGVHDSTEAAAEDMGSADEPEDAASEVEAIAEEDDSEDATEGEPAPLNLFGGEFDDDAGDDLDDADVEDAAIAAEFDDDDDASDDIAEPATEAAEPRHPAFATDPDSDEAAMSRILARTDDQLSDPDINRRRESLAQTKAAVAAREAALQLGEGKADDDESADDFRKDLRQAVRPRRPVRDGDRVDARTERPRAAPLKLVAAQRVDIEAEESESLVHRPAMPVRPRRVRSEAAHTEAGGDSSFEAFARDMGAHSLGDLLEAAAAYTSYVEGSEDFSRPQLMNKIRGVSEEDFSREEGLRSFGTLLREGRIMKVRNGRFQVSEETRFHPERRAG